ncbi:Short transient receptor potential channel 5 [Armadillidium vulgare]|nr:Short transient receptor potential channel 5 [Armadillidium vulgare]
MFKIITGFLFEEIQEIKIDGIRKYFKNMWNILDVLRDTLYITTIFLKIGAYIQQNFEISENPRIYSRNLYIFFQSAYTPKEEWNSFDPQLISEGFLFEATQSLFWAGFGMVGLSDFELTGIREYTRFWSMLMFGTFSVINIIVLLNLLIAMMSSSYSFIVTTTTMIVFRYFRSIN